MLWHATQVSTRYVPRHHNNDITTTTTATTQQPAGNVTQQTTPIRPTAAQHSTAPHLPRDDQQKERPVVPRPVRQREANGAGHRREQRDDEHGAVAPPTRRLDPLPEQGGRAGRPRRRERELRSPILRAKLGAGGGVGRQESGSGDGERQSAMGNGSGDGKRQGEGGRDGGQILRVWVGEADEASNGKRQVNTTFRCFSKGEQRALMKAAATASRGGAERQRNSYRIW